MASRYYVEGQEKNSGRILDAVQRFREVGGGVRLFGENDGAPGVEAAKDGQKSGAGVYRMTPEQYNRARVLIAKAQARLLKAKRAGKMEAAVEHIDEALRLLGCYGKVEA